jgi:hypothetical protein
MTEIAPTRPAKKPARKQNGACLVGAQTVAAHLTRCPGPMCATLPSAACLCTVAPMCELLHLDQPLASSRCRDQ